MVDKIKCSPPGYDSLPRIMVTPETRTVTMVRSGKAFGFKAQSSINGHYISTVNPGSTAEKAGLQKGDGIVEVNGFNVKFAVHSRVIELMKEGGEHLTLVVDKNWTKEVEIERVVDEFTKWYDIYCSPDSDEVTSASATEVPPTFVDYMKANASGTPICAEEFLTSNTSDSSSKSVDIEEETARPLACSDDLLSFEAEPEIQNCDSEEKVPKLPKKQMKLQEKDVREWMRVRELRGKTASKTDEKCHRCAQKLEKAPEQPRYLWRSFHLMLIAFVLQAEVPLLYKDVTSITVGPQNVSRRFDPTPHMVYMAVPNENTPFGFLVGGSQEKSGQQFVTFITPDSAAAQFGLRTGDRILKVNGNNVLDSYMERVMDFIEQYPRFLSMMVVSTSDENVKKLIAGEIEWPQLEKDILDAKVTVNKSYWMKRIIPLTLVTVMAFEFLFLMVYSENPGYLIFTAILRLMFETTCAGFYVILFILKFLVHKDSLSKLLSEFTANFPVHLKEMLCHVDDQWTPEELTSRTVTASFLAVFLMCVHKMVQVWILKSCWDFLSTQYKSDPRQTENAKTTTRNFSEGNKITPKRYVYEQRAAYDLADK